VDDPVRLGVDHVGTRLVARERVGNALARLRVDDLDAAESRTVNLIAK
jgi:hypothetical protein